jgi:hypothetical protein
MRLDQVLEQRFSPRAAYKAVNKDMQAKMGCGLYIPHAVKVPVAMPRRTGVAFFEGRSFSRAHLDCIASADQHVNRAAQRVPNTVNLQHGGIRAQGSQRAVKLELSLIGNAQVVKVCAVRGCNNLCSEDGRSILLHRQQGPQQGS